MEAKALDANLLQVARGAPEAGFAALIDYQTLVTHNHTIICGSLGEGLTYSPCARHAQAYCHKKDCVVREVLFETITAHSFKFLFTVSCPNLIGDFRDCFSLIYSKKNFCKSCDRFNQIRNCTISISLIKPISAHYNLSTPARFKVTLPPLQGLATPYSLSYTMH